MLRWRPLLTVPAHVYTCSRNWGRARSVDAGLKGAAHQHRWHMSSIRQHSRKEAMHMCVTHALQQQA